MANVRVALLVMAALWWPGAQGPEVSQDARKKLEFELLKRLEIARMKAQIAQELGIDLEATKEESGPPNRLPDEFVQRLLSKNRTVGQQPTNLARLLFSPTNTNLQCLWHTDASCRRFEFNIPPAMLYKTTEFWIYQIERLPSGNHSITALCSRRGEQIEHLMEHDEIDQGNEDDKWRNFHLPMLYRLTRWSGSATCAIEISGSVIDEKQNLPYLKIAQDLEHLKRSRRSTDLKEPEDLEEPEACRPISFVVTFIEIGFGQFFSYPDSFNAYVCKGHCVKSRNFYETVMDMVFTRNTTLETEYGRCWASRCTPKEFENMDVIFTSKTDDGDSVHNVTTLVNIIAKTCTCR